MLQPYTAAFNHRSRMSITLISNQKGGVGKTTIVVNLAAALVRRHNARVLVVDLDSQGSLTTWLGHGAEDHRFAEVMRGQRRLRDAILSTDIGVDLVPGGAHTAQLIADTSTAELTAQFRRLFPVDEYDVVLMDAAPGTGPLTLAGLASADDVLIPVELSGLAVSGVIQSIQLVQHLQAPGVNPNLKLRGILVNQFDRRKSENHRMLKVLREHVGGKLCRTVIRTNSPLSDAYNYRVSIFEYKPRSPGAEDFQALAAEYVQQNHDA